MRALQGKARAFKDEDYMEFRNGKENLYFPLALGITYNYGYRKLDGMTSLAALSGLKLPNETQIYLEKIKYVWHRLTKQRFG